MAHLIVAEDRRGEERRSSVDLCSVRSEYQTQGQSPPVKQDIRRRAVERKELNVNN